MPYRNKKHRGWQQYSLKIGSAITLEVSSLERDEKHRVTSAEILVIRIFSGAGLITGRQLQWLGISRVCALDERVKDKRQTRRKHERAGDH
jgi:hypothetical protein